jgi:hypothetical protein
VTLWSVRSGRKVSELTADDSAGSGPVDVAYQRGAVAVACTAGISLFHTSDTREAVITVGGIARRAGEPHLDVKAVQFVDEGNPTLLVVGTAHDVRLCDLRYAS